MSQVPDNLHYSADHEWVQILESKTAVVGITDHAQHSLSDIVYVELPEMGARVAKGEAIAIVESVKAASDIYAPLSGQVVKLNEALEETPELLNESPYELGWMFHLAPENLEAELADLMGPEGYRDHIADPTE